MQTKAPAPSMARDPSEHCHQASCERSPETPYPFLCLPTEIRLEIYKALFPPHNEHAHATELRSFCKGPWQNCVCGAHVAKNKGQTLSAYFTIPRAIARELGEAYVTYISLLICQILWLALVSWWYPSLQLAVRSYFRSTSRSDGTRASMVPFHKTSCLTCRSGCRGRQPLNVSGAVWSSKKNEDALPMLLACKTM